ncbi:hypothetical protein TorRG33x02_156860 [Trema orientale]|uniref:Uncharacterized protein n=1 Tax=Trema orientale TaxID=63057 RepID=A0A2P5ESH1_TREOI|nr:hypothetical protein TorRG33x02_156860 [Trema orientale]
MSPSIIFLSMEVVFVARLNTFLAFWSGDHDLMEWGSMKFDLFLELLQDVQDKLSKVYEGPGPRDATSLLLEEEDYWRHGSRTTWLESGDQNAHTFSWKSLSKRSLLPCNLMMDGLEMCTVFSREFRV